jgi:CDP-paratose 2-epimerase
VNPTTLVTGGAGFIGTNLADRLLSAGGRVRILDDLSRDGVEANLAWLEQRHGSALQVQIGDVCDPAVVLRAMRGAEAVFHLAAQVAVTTSLEDPVTDLAVNLTGSVNVLEAARARPAPPPVVFTSTNKVYGGLADIRLRKNGAGYEPVDARTRTWGIGERRPLAFCTPYGCSKGAADQYVLDYAHSYGMPTAVFRMSCIYGPHQCGNEDQGWVAHFARQALRDEPITLYGDGEQVRDVLFVEDLVDALLLARDRMEAIEGQAFNIGGGPSRAVCLREVVELIGRLRGAAPELRFGPWRTGDQRYYVTDTRRFAGLTGWRPRVAPAEGIARLYAALEHAAEPPRLSHAQRSAA